MKKTKTKYTRALFSIPDDIYLKFKEMTLPGERSRIVTGFMRQYIASHKSQKKKSFWDDIEKYNTEACPNEDPVKTVKNVWKKIIDRY